MTEAKTVTQVLKDKVVLPDGSEIPLPPGCTVTPMDFGPEAENVITKVTLGSRTVLMHDAMDTHTTSMKIFLLTTPDHRDHPNAAEEDVSGTLSVANDPFHPLLED